MIMPKAKPKEAKTKPPNNGPSTMAMAVEKVRL